MPTQIIALPDVDAAQTVLMTASQSLDTLRQDHRHGVITEHELAERSFHGIMTVIEDLVRILRAMEGPVPERPWPLGTALSMPHQGIGILIANDGAECTVRLGDRDVIVPSAECEWAWHPEPSTQRLAQETHWPSDTVSQVPSR
ncbi:MAG: hypothetical protein C7B46_16495 [Sulfobacillus benefaciens]|uniref:Uncharacterized protein n=1 Tax=Sulfobacillus benefaciens TaxID=453960 RepID=A0A2T2XAU6_9FIRM|nr:MAG: hypothetical protein C7B46_16495 [Sulfobacillus benefaciens]